MHHEVAVGPLPRSLANPQGEEFLAFLAEPAPGFLDDALQVRALRIIADRSAGPVDVDTGVEGMADLLGIDGSLREISGPCRSNVIRMTLFWSVGHSSSSPLEQRVNS